MRSLRPSLTIVLFAGSVAAIACGDDGNDDGPMATTKMDAAVVAMPGGGTAGLAPVDAGAAPAFLGGGLGSFDASGLIGAAREAGVIGTSPDGGISFDPGAACRLAPMFCSDGSLTVLGGLGGLGAAGGGLAGLGGGLTAGGLAGLGGGLTAGAGGLTAGGVAAGGATTGGVTGGGASAGGTTAGTSP